MKKLLLVLAIGAFVACNDEGTTDGTAIDSTSTTTVDSTTITVDTSNRSSVDTTAAGDTTLRK